MIDTRFVGKSRTSSWPHAADRASSPSRGAMVPAVARAAQLLNTLAASERPLPLTALVKTLALPKSTVHGCALRWRTPVLSSDWTTALTSSARG